MRVGPCGGYGASHRRPQLAGLPDARARADELGAMSRSTRARVTIPVSGEVATGALRGVRPVAPTPAAAAEAGAGGEAQVGAARGAVRARGGAGDVDGGRGALPRPGQRGDTTFRWVRACLRRGHAQTHQRVVLRMTWRWSLGQSSARVTLQPSSPRRRCWSMMLAASAVFESIVGEAVSESVKVNRSGMADSEINASGLDPLDRCIAHGLYCVLAVLAVFQTLLVGLNFLVSCSSGQLSHGY